MARSREIPISLPSVDDLFTAQEERDEAAREKVSELPLGAIDPFPDHPFRVRDDEEMADLASSVAECGVLTPVVVRPKGDGRYELVSGHRRKRGLTQEELAQALHHPPGGEPVGMRSHRAQHRHAQAHRS